MSTTPDDILTAVLIGLLFVVVLVVGNAMGKKLQRKRWPPGDSNIDSGDQGGMPVRPKADTK